MAFLLVLAAGAIALAACAVAAQETGTLQGEVTIVGQESLRDGEVVISLKGKDVAFDIANFHYDEPSYSIELPPGEYTAYATAPVFHPTERLPFTIEANGTTWMNFTIVRQEELLGEVRDEDGSPLPDVVLQFLQNGSVMETTKTNEDGRFRETIDPGTYQLKVTKRGYVANETELVIGPGEVKELDLVLESLPGEEDEDELPTMAIMVGVIIVAAFLGSVGYLRYQVARLRRAAAEAEAKRAKDSLCIECGAIVPEGSGQCPACGHVLQVRCSECGRLVDAGTAECPECGSSMG